jgi:hypothetical protein
VLFLAHICYCTCTLLTLRDVYATRNVFRAAFNKLSGDLGQKVEVVTTEVKHLSETVATSSFEVNSGSSSDPSTASDRVLSALLSAAKDLPPLDRKDFKFIVHWFPTAYRELRKGAPKTEDNTEDDLLALEVDDTETANTKSGSSKKKKDPTLPAFLEDKDGKLASRDERAAISALARSFWQYLLVKQRALKPLVKSTSRSNFSSRDLWRRTSSAFATATTTGKSTSSGSATIPRGSRLRFESRQRKQRRRQKKRRRRRKLA